MDLTHTIRHSALILILTPHPQLSHTGSSCSQPAKNSIWGQQWLFWENHRLFFGDPRGASFMTCCFIPEEVEEVQTSDRPMTPTDIWSTWTDSTGYSLEKGGSSHSSVSNQWKCEGLCSDIEVTVTFCVYTLFNDFISSISVPFSFHFFEEQIHYKPTLLLSSFIKNISHVIRN